MMVTWRWRTWAVWVICLYMVVLMMVMLDIDVLRGQADHVSSADVNAVSTIQTADATNTSINQRRHQAEVERRMLGRWKRMEAACSVLRDQQHDVTVSDRIKISTLHRFLHCPVTKAASNFWYRFLHAMDMPEPMESPFTFPVITNVTAALTSLGTIRYSDDRAAFVTSAVRNVFARNPYSRMFSAYVDKVFAPNPIFWNFWGRKAIKAFRRNADSRSLLCGHDVTFAELMSLVAARLHKSDEHFQSVFHLCQPCRIRYNFVGRMETFAEDLVHLAQNLDLPTTTYFESPQFKHDYVRDAIEDSVYSPFSWMEEVLQCMSKYEAGLRIWRKLQVRGLLSRRIGFPYSEAEFLHVTSEQFVESAISAHRKSTDIEELRQQKRTALVEAFRSVNSTVLYKLARVFAADFFLFDYDMYPEEVFKFSQRSGDVSVKALDWSQDW